MTKPELSDLLNSLNIPVAEGEQAFDKAGKYPNITYWEFYWEPISASGKTMETKVTYQISYLSKKPRSEKLMQLVKKLGEAGIMPSVSHEYLADKNVFHSYCSVEVTEEFEYGNT